MTPDKHPAIPDMIKDWPIRARTPLERMRYKLNDLREEARTDEFSKHVFHAINMAVLRCEEDIKKEKELRDAAGF